MQEDVNDYNDFEVLNDEDESPPHDGNQNNSLI